MLLLLRLLVRPIHCMASPPLARQASSTADMKGMYRCVPAATMPIRFLCVCLTCGVMLVLVCAGLLVPRVDKAGKPACELCCIRLRDRPTLPHPPGRKCKPRCSKQSNKEGRAAALVTIEAPQSKMSLSPKGTLAPLLLHQRATWPTHQWTLQTEYSRHAVSTAAAWRQPRPPEACRGAGAARCRSRAFLAAAARRARRGK